MKGIWEAFQKWYVDKGFIFHFFGLIKVDSKNAARKVRKNLSWEKTKKSSKFEQKWFISATMWNKVGRDSPRFSYF